MLDRQIIAKQLDDLFGLIQETGIERYPIDELVILIESVIPVHVKIGIDMADDVDSLLAIYPYLYQKLVVMYALLIHKARTGGSDKRYIADMRSYRDAMEQLLRAVKLQYDSLSRRITVSVEK
jgi:hypothetical protein